VLVSECDLLMPNPAIKTQEDLTLGVSRLDRVVRGADGDTAMSDPYTERLAAVRLRFVAKLDARIEEIESSLPQLSRENGLEVLEQAHRRAHDLCGIGPTLGYVETGKAARSIEQLLLAAVKAKRTLTEDEGARLREGIAHLRSTAGAEIHPPAQA
jgi:HPt (histidine-containing phosphotransfer) domain-containing protein